MALDRFEAHVFGGLGGPLTDTGTQEIDKLIDKLPPIQDNKHWIWQKSASVAQSIIDNIKKNGKCPVILGGHSYGVLAAMRVARELDKQKIGVDYFYAIDPTAGRSQAKEMVAYNNIKDIDEFWATRGFPASARRRTNNKQGCLTIPKDWVGTYNLHIIPGGHIPCASDEKVHKIVMDKVKEILL